MTQTIFKDQLFKDQVAVVTGGGSGIGLRTACEFALLGATVVIGSRDPQKLEQGAAAIAATGGKVHALSLNIRDPESVNTFVDQTLERCGKIDHLVNNAGGQFPSPAEQISPKGWKAVVDTNLNGTFFMSQAVYNKAFSDHGGAIVNVIANMWNGFPNMAHTGAARAGVDNLTKTLAVEWGRSGVRVNAVAPGAIYSSGIKTYDPEFQKFFLQAGAHNQTYRLGSEAEVAASILFLCSPAANFISGATLRVDGAESLPNARFAPVDHGRLPAWDDEDL
ncbi:MAG: SDR family oxidoreductase [Pseudomonadota bacterium]|nr:SDR family oxidoreductase [Pseudomonadota bacterium]